MILTYHVLAQIRSPTFHYRKRSGIKDGIDVPEAD
jgi:hypothetical protein